MFVFEKMKTDLISVRPETTLAEAKALMQDNNFRHLPVVDQNDKLVGIITDRDMRDAHPSSLLSQEAYQRTLAEVMQHPVEKIMTRDPITISPYYTLQDTLLVIGQKKVGALPVVDEEGHLKGIMSTRDLLQAFVNIMGIDEPGTLLCILVNGKDRTVEARSSISSPKKTFPWAAYWWPAYWDKEKRAIFPYLLTNNVMAIKKKLLAEGFELLDPMKWYLDQLPNK